MGMTQRSSFRYFKTSPEIIRMAMMMCIRFPWLRRKVENLPHQRGFNVRYETLHSLFGNWFFW